MKAAFLHKKVLELYRSGNLLGLETPCRELLSIAPNNPEAMFLLGVSLRAAGNRLAACEYFKKAADADVSNVTFTKVAADELLAVGEFNQAIGYFLEILGKQPGTVAIYNDLGHCYFALGKPWDAIKCYRKALEIRPNDTFVLSNLGNALLDLGRKKTALSAYREATKTNPGFATAYYHMYPALFQQDHPEDAIVVLKKAAELANDNTYVLCHLAMLLDISGNKHEAGAIFKDIGNASGQMVYLLDSWDYVKQHTSSITRLFTLSFDSLRFAFSHAQNNGLILEFGVRNGTSINFISRLTRNRIHGFDSFEGLPADWLGEKKGLYSTGSILPRVSSNVELHKGWFEDTLPVFARNNREQIRFMNVDCDIYSSTHTIFECFEEQIIPGTVIIFDEYLFNPDWQNDEYKAFQELVKEKKLKYEYLLFSLFSKQAAVVIR